MALRVVNVNSTLHHNFHRYQRQLRVLSLLKTGDPSAANRPRPLRSLRNSLRAPLSCKIGTVIQSDGACGSSVPGP